MSKANSFKKDAFSFFMILLVVGLFRTFFFDWSYIPSASMEPTLYEDDYVLINKTVYGPTIPFTSIKLWTLNDPERGDVIVFYPPDVDKQYIKRVIGVPGDVITIYRHTATINGETLVVNAEKNDKDELIGIEKLLGKDHKIKVSPNGLMPLISRDKTIPDGYYFVMGDHRSNSRDSRFFGLVPIERILGTTQSLLLSFSDKRNFLDTLIMSIDEDAKEQ